MTAIVPMPFYDYLLNVVNTSTTSRVDVRQICNIINHGLDKLPPQEYQEHYDAILALIVHHEKLQTGGNSFCARPYNGKPLAKSAGILYTLNDLPPILQHIIAAYLTYVLGTANVNF